MSGFRIPNVNAYYRQYLGIVVAGKHLIYINAFESSGGPPNEWLVEPVTACDGGLGSWGAVFDPSTGLFSELAFNGEA